MRPGGRTLSARVARYVDMLHDTLTKKFDEVSQSGRTGLIMFLTAGFPDMATTRELIPALAEAGADCIELGVPFSDPLADGPTIQASSFRALENGVTLGSCLEMVTEVRSQVPNTPVVLLGYYNPILSYGLARFAQDAATASVDGVIVADLPPDEAGPLLEECRPRGVHVIPLLAPTSTDARIQRACGSASGFVYCLSLTGVTGARREVSPGIFRLLERVRAYTSLPLAVGFGVSRREQVEALEGRAQAVVVGSGLVQVIMDSPRGETVDRVGRYVQELAGVAPTAKAGPG